MALLFRGAIEVDGGRRRAEDNDSISGKIKKKIWSDPTVYSIAGTWDFIAVTPPLFPEGKAHTPQLSLSGGN
jgi:hypothetical protein